MKKTIFYVSVLTVLFSFVSCGNDDERLRKEIIGSYRYSNTNETANFQVSIDGVETFNEDGTVEDESLLSIVFSNEKLGEASLTYRMKYTGTYEIENSYILYDYSDVDDDGSLELLSAEGSKGSEVFIEELSAQLESTLIPDIRERLTEENAADIYELTKEKLVILNAMGQEIVKVRIVGNN